MPPDSVGADPQYRQMGRQGCADGASVGPEHSQEMGSGGMALGAQGARTEQGMGAAEAAWQ